MFFTQFKCKFDKNDVFLTYRVSELILKNNLKTHFFKKKNKFLVFENPVAPSKCKITKFSFYCKFIVSVCKCLPHPTG